MHIAFVSLGAFGHINPTLALVTELVKKGVRVTYFTTESVEKFSASASVFLKNKVEAQHIDIG